MLSIVAGCDDDTSDANGTTTIPSGNPPLVTNQGATPRLAAGTHIDYIVGFDALNAERLALADSLRAQAIAAGIQGNRIQVDWGVLESQPGVFDRAELTEQLDIAGQMGQAVFVTLTTLDTGELTFPVDLVSADGNTPSAGLRLDGPEIQVRLQTFLDWLIPELAAYNVWGLSLANEPSTNAEFIEVREITNFLIQAADYANTLDSDLAITVTLASATDTSQNLFTTDVMAHLDIAMYNYYCIGFELQVTDQPRWASDIALFINAAGGRDIFFQELGCPVGYSDLGGGVIPPEQIIGASLQSQQAFFQFMMDQLIDNEQLRGASIFQLFDWSPELTDFFTQTLINPDEPGSEITAARLREWLTTVGMCRWSDGVCREAWNVFLDGVRRAVAQRAMLSLQDGQPQ